VLCSNPYILTTKQDKKAGKRIELNSPLTIPCGKCDLCLSARAKKWAEQCMLEAKLTNLQTHCNLFTTLTYADEFLPENNSLCKNDLSAYLKKIHNLNASKNQKIRFFAAGEYGDKTHRPHYHLILFNVPRTWIVKSWQKSGKDYLSVLSPLLTDIWNKGEIADINLIGRGYDNDDSSYYAIKYASQSHQKGGINYHNFVKKIKVKDGRWLDVKQPKNTPEWIDVVKAQSKRNEIEYIDNLGRVRPFRRMSVGLGLKIAMRLKSVSEPVLLGKAMACITSVAQKAILTACLCRQLMPYIICLSPFKPLLISSAIIMTLRTALESSSKILNIITSLFLLAVSRLINTTARKLLLTD